MKIRLKKDMPTLHPTLKAGDLIDCNAAEAAAYIANGTAEDPDIPKKPTLSRHQKTDD